MNTDSRFQQMMKDLEDIAALVELYPDNLKERVFRMLMDARCGPDIERGNSRNSTLSDKGRRGGSRTGKTQLSIQRERDAIRGSENSGYLKVCGYGLKGDGTFCIVPPSWTLGVVVPENSGLPMAGVIEKLLRARKENSSKSDRVYEKYEPVLDGNKLIFSKQHNEKLKIRSFSVNWKRGEDGVPRVVRGSYGEDDSRDYPLELRPDSVSTADAYARNIGDPKDFYQFCDISRYNDMQASAIVAYYYTVLAPEGKILPGISNKEYIEMCIVTERKLPADAKGTLNNAQYRGYLVSEGRGQYSLSNVGMNFMREVLGR